MPSTEAIDQPRKMKVMARPRCSGGAIVADGRGRLRREDGGADDGERAQRQQRGVAGCQRRQRVAGGVPQQRAA